MALDLSSLRAALPIVDVIPQPYQSLTMPIAKAVLDPRLAIGDFFRLRRVCRWLANQYSISSVRHKQYQALLQSHSPKPSFGLSWDQRVDFLFQPRFLGVTKLAKVDLEKPLRVASLDSWRVVEADLCSCVLRSRFGHQISVDITKKKPVTTYAKIEPFEQTPAKATLSVPKVHTFQFSNGKLFESKPGVYVIENGSKVVVQDSAKVTLYTMEKQAKFKKIWERLNDEDQLVGFVGEKVILQRAVPNSKRALCLIGANELIAANKVEATFTSEKSDHLTRLIGSVLVTVSGCKMCITDIYCDYTTIFERTFKKPVLSYLVNNLQIAVLCGNGKLYYAPLVSKSKG